jgi:hypothetical protein
VRHGATRLGIPNTKCSGRFLEAEMHERFCRGQTPVCQEIRRGIGSEDLGLLAQVVFTPLDNPYCCPIKDRQPICLLGYSYCTSERTIRRKRE